MEKGNHLCSRSTGLGKELTTQIFPTFKLLQFRKASRSDLAFRSSKLTFRHPCIATSDELLRIQKGTSFNYVGRSAG